MRADIFLGRTKRNARLVVLGVLVAAAGACSADEPKLDISGLHACDVLDSTQLDAIGVDHVSAQNPAGRAQGGGSNGDYTRCTWKSSPRTAWYSISVSLQPSRDNAWVGKKGKTEPVSGSRTSLLGYQMSVAAGPDRGVIGIELLRAKKPIREITEMVVENLRSA